VGRLVPLPTLWHFNGTRILAPQLLSKKTAILQLPAYMDLNIKNKLSVVIQIGRFGLYDDLACEPLATSYSSLKTEVCVPAETSALLQWPSHGTPVLYSLQMETKHGFGRWCHRQEPEYPSRHTRIPGHAGPLSGSPGLPQSRRLSGRNSSRIFPRSAAKTPSPRLRTPRPHLSASLDEDPSWRMCSPASAESLARSWVPIRSIRWFRRTRERRSPDSRRSRQIRCVAHCGSRLWIRAEFRRATNRYPYWM